MSQGMGTTVKYAVSASEIAVNGPDLESATMTLDLSAGSVTPEPEAMPEYTSTSEAIEAFVARLDTLKAVVAAYKEALTADVAALREMHDSFDQQDSNSAQVFE